MNNKIKALGLALVAALALTAVMASTASAQFTSNKEHTIISGSQTTSHSFSAGSGFGAISCTTATFAGTANATNEETQVVQPTYSGCKDSLGRTVDIDNGGLTYTFTPVVTTRTKSDNTLVATHEPTVHVSGAMTLTVTSGGSVICTVTITSPQTNNGITYTNLGGTKGVEVKTNATNVKSTIEGGFFNCGTSTTNATAGTYTGTTVVTGKDTSGAAAEISTHHKIVTLDP